MLSRTEGRDLGSRLLHALPFQGGLPRPPAYVDVAMVDERRRERRAFAAKCVGKAVQRIAGAFSQSGRPHNGLPRSGESRPRFWARLPPSAACRSLPSAELRAGTIRSRLESRRATFHAAMVLVASPSRTSPWSDLGLAGGTRWGRASCVHPAHGRGLLHPLRCFALSMRLRR